MVMTRNIYLLNLNQNEISVSNGVFFISWTLRIKFGACFTLDNCKAFQGRDVSADLAHNFL